MTRIIYAPALTLERYAACFSTFRRCSREREAMLAWTEQALYPSLREGKELSILSIGCGTGEFDLELLKLIAPRCRHTRFLGLEPNHVHHAALEARLSRLADEHAACSTARLPFELFRSSERFDLILFTHCLYYIPQRLQALLHALELLTPDGRIVVFHQTTAGISQLQRRFLAEVKGSTEEMLSAADLAALMQQAGISYRYCELDQCVDVTRCFADDSSGLDLLSFFLESDVEALPGSKREDIRRYLDSICFRAPDRRLLRQPVGVFQIRRTAEPLDEELPVACYPSAL